MNICKEIIDQLSGDSLSKLSSLIGSDNETTGDAISAAVPALMSGLAGLASRDDGAKRLTNAFSQLGSTGMDDFASNLGGDANALAQKGTGLLSGLFGDSMLSGLTNAVAKYAGLGSSSVKGLLAFLAPMVLGKVANLWRARGATPQALTNLFAEQRENIADCAPTGLSLADVPGWPGAQHVTRTAAAQGRRAVAVGESAGQSFARWAIPLALAALAAFAIWTFMRDRDGRDATAERTRDAANQEVTAMKPVTPEAAALAEPAAVNRQLEELYASVDKVMASITDAASAEAARPQLEQLSAKIDAMSKTIDRLPQAGKATVQQFGGEKLETFKTQADATLQTPGLSADIKALISSILQKLTELFAPATS